MPVSFFPLIFHNHFIVRLMCGGAGPAAAIHSPLGWYRNRDWLAPRNLGHATLYLV